MASSRVCRRAHLEKFQYCFIGAIAAGPAGDLLIYYQPQVRKFPLPRDDIPGRAGIAPDADDWVVYHTGSSAVDKGTVKKVELEVLDHHPDPRWRPLESNRNFLGFYRLKILD